MSAFRETNVLEANIDINRPELKEKDEPRIYSNTKFRDNLFLDSSDSFEAAFKKLGLITDTSDKKKSDVNDSSEDKDYSDYLEKGNDGKYYDKETGKSYDSIEAWEKELETLAEKYEFFEKYYKEKANEAWESFKNAEKNGESSDKKWEHYRLSQEYYTKSKECKEKAEKIRVKLENTSDSFNESNQADTNKEQNDVSESKDYSGRELLDKAENHSDELAETIDNPRDAERIKELCDKISDNLQRVDEIEPSGELLPEYQQLMDEKGYESEEEMCNVEGLNLDEIYDDEPSTYGEEYSKGFIDCIDEDKDPNTISDDDCSEPYYEGMRDAQELKDLINAN